MSDPRNPWERLRNCEYVMFKDGFHSKTLGREAANEIEHLRALLAIQDDKVANLTRELAEARDKALEEAEKAVEDMFDEDGFPVPHASKIAAAIRALKEKP